MSNATVALVCPAADVRDLAGWLPAIEIVGQQGEGLAAGLASAFRTFIDRGYRRVVTLDGDSPQLPPETLDNAFELLEEANLTLGPTTDGGYCLVGSKTVQTELFDTQELGTVAALYLPFLVHGQLPLGSIGGYLTRRRVNAPVYTALEWVFPPSVWSVFQLLSGSRSLSGRVAIWTLIHRRRGRGR